MKKNGNTKSNFNLQKILNQEKIGVCYKMLSGRVISQNKNCIQYCGNLQGKICQKGCMEYLTFTKKTLNHTNPYLLYQRAIDYRPFDIVFLTSQNHLINLINPLSIKPSIPDKLKTINDFDCTSREYEIATMMLKGYSNQEICKKLFISRATLKTHINRLYKKLEDHNCSFKLR